MNSTAVKLRNNSEKEGKLLIDIYEASDLLGLKVSRLRMAVFRKEIPYRKIGGLVRFVPKELADWINSDVLRPTPRFR